MAKKDKSNNEDRKDIKEDSHWRCPYCHQSGPCVKEQESTALLAHLIVVHPDKL